MNLDAHFLKAMVAPRTLIVAEAASDIWTNPIGTWMTTQGAGEVYKLYEKEEIDRINELYRKSKAEGLTEEEKNELERDIVGHDVYGFIQIRENKKKTQSNKSENKSDIRRI